MISAANYYTNKSEYLPTKLVESNLLSPTSEAYNCFVGQAFSGKLQAYLISYVISVTNAYAIYK